MNLLKNQQQPDILFVVNDFSFLRSHRLNLINYLIKKGLNISLATNLSSCSELELKSLHATFQDVVDFRDNRSSINPLSNLISLIKLFLIIKRIAPKKLSLVSPKPIILGGLASLFLDIKKVFFTISGMGYVFIDQSLKARFLRRLVLLLYKIIFSPQHSIVIFQNSDDRSMFLDKKIVPRSRSIIIQGNGINMSSFDRKSKYPEKLTFLFASRLLIDKGIYEYIKALESIDNKNIIFKVAGGIDEKNPNSLSLTDLDILESNKRIDYIGKVDYKDMPALLESAHIFVLPSYREGLPQVALEAAACSMPLILTDVNGCRDCVIDNEGGFLVNSHDWKDLREKINFFIENSEKVELMGNQSRQYVMNNFSDTVVHKKFFELYSD